MLARRQTGMLETVIAIALLAALAGAALGFAPEGTAPARHQSRQANPDDSVRISATLIQVPVTVTDRAGKFIESLSRNDFTLYENGRRQEITFFENLEQPLTAVLVLDTSNSTQDRLRAIQNTARGFARQIKPGDRLMVIAFDHDVHLLSDFTSDVAEVEKAIQSAESGFGKLLYEAVERALEELRDVQGRRAVILFSDGIDMRSVDASAESSIRLAEETGAVIYVVRFETRWWAEAQARKDAAEESRSRVPVASDGRIPLPPEMGGHDPNPSGIPRPKAPRVEVGTGSGSPTGFPNRGPNSRPVPKDEITETLDTLYGEADAYLESLTARTGGRLFPAADFDQTRLAYQRVTQELRNFYQLGYYSTDDPGKDGYYKIKVEVAVKDLKVRARPGHRPLAQDR